MKRTIKTLLSDRQVTHGSFEDNASFYCQLRELVGRNPGADGEADQVITAALDMLLMKLARISSGQADTAEHWEDIAGYATLVANYLLTGKCK